MTYLILAIAIAAVAFYAYKNKDKILAGFRKDQISAPNSAPNSGTVVSPIEVHQSATAPNAGQIRVADTTPVAIPLTPEQAQPNVGLGGFRASAETLAILAERASRAPTVGGPAPTIDSVPQPITKASDGAGSNFLVDIGPTPVVLNVIGPIRFDAVATADSPARGGTFFHFSAAGVNGQDSANAASISLPEGGFMVKFWADEPAKAWIVFR